MSGIYIIWRAREDTLPITEMLRERDGESRPHEDVNENNILVCFSKEQVKRESQQLNSNTALLVKGVFRCLKIF
jgi:hypothetical protein